MKKSKFKVVVPAYNCLSWLPRCFDSIASQTYRDFDVVVVDDASTEEGQWEWTERFCRNQGWPVYRMEENGGTLAAMARAIEMAECEEEEIIITIDGDDWLAHDGVFAYLDSVYSQGRVDMTYGQFSLFSTGEAGFVRPYDPVVVEQNLYRRSRVIWSHLRTFRSFLWHAIEDRDLRGGRGQYYRYATDHVFMTPMLEMAGKRHCAIEEILYVYNDKNSASDSFRVPGLHFATRKFIRGLPPYDVLDRCRK